MKVKKSSLCVPGFNITLKSCQMVRDEGDERLWVKNMPLNIDFTFTDFYLPGAWMTYTGMHESIGIDAQFEFKQVFRSQNSDADTILWEEIQDVLYSYQK